MADLKKVVTKLENKKMTSTVWTRWFRPRTRHHLLISFGIFDWYQCFKQFNIIVLWTADRWRKRKRFKNSSNSGKCLMFPRSDVVVVLFEVIPILLLSLSPMSFKCLMFPDFDNLESMRKGTFLRCQIVDLFLNN